MDTLHAFVPFNVQFLFDFHSSTHQIIIYCFERHCVRRLTSTYTWWCQWRQIGSSSSRWIHRGKSVRAVQQFLASVMWLDCATDVRGGCQPPHAGSKCTSVYKSKPFIYACQMCRSHRRHIHLLQLQAACELFMHEATRRDASTEREKKNIYRLSILSWENRSRFSNSISCIAECQLIGGEKVWSDTHSYRFCSWSFVRFRLSSGWTNYIHLQN